VSTSSPAAAADRPEDEHTPDEHTPDEHTPDEHPPDDHTPDEHPPDEHPPDEHPPTGELPRRPPPTPAEVIGDGTEPTSATTSKETETSPREDATAASHQASTDERTRQSTPASEIAKKTAADESGLRATIRVVAVYGTPWPLPDGIQLSRVTDHLALSDLASAPGTAQLPGVFAQTAHEPSSLRMASGNSGARSLGVTTWLFALPSGRLVAALALDVVNSSAEVRPLLADLLDGRAEINGASLDAVFASPAGASGQLAPERHVLAFFGDGSRAAPDEAAVAGLLYPALHRAGASDAVIYHPPEEGAGGAAWLSANATVTAGHRQLLDNAFVLSAVLAVGAATRLREIRAAAYSAVGEYRAAGSELRSTHASRRFLEGLASRLGDLEAELAFAVDAATDAGAVLPYRPVESYHRTLVHALDTNGRALAVGRILSRLAQGLTAELVAVTSAEWRVEERRRALWNGFAWILALIGIPTAIALGYASGQGGYTDSEDIRAYIIAGIVAIVLVIGYVVVASTVRRRTRRRHRG
jgi:hypothetical protein